METISADELGTLLTLSAAALGSLLVIVVNCIHGSKCTHIKCCGFQCDRVLPPVEGDDGDADTTEDLRMSLGDDPRHE
eukprot:COSAG01_NODE_20182_length_966_cov_3.381776_2_plen_78_part_00